MINFRYKRFVYGNSSVYTKPSIPETQKRKCIFLKVKVQSDYGKVTNTSIQDIPITKLAGKIFNKSSDSNNVEVAESNTFADNILRTELLLPSFYLAAGTS